MARRIDATTLKAWLRDGGEIALLDVREHGQYGEGHPLFAVPLPYSRFELGLAPLVPNPAVRLVLCDGDDGVAERAAARAEALGYGDVSILAEGVEGWRRAGYTLYAGVNVPSKVLGELVEHARGTPHVSAEALHAMLAAGEDVAILDGRTFAEFQRMSIPGAVSCPNGELALRVGALVPSPATRIVVNCAGRTRSIIGAQTLIDLGVPNAVHALENGTQGWFLAGLQLDRGSNRRYRDAAGPADLAPLQARARALAEAHGVAFVGVDKVLAWLADRSRTTYVLDVRSPEEHARDAVPGIAQAPGGQLVQATDQWIGTRGARIVLVDDEQVRAPVTAQWLARLGYEACVLEGGIAACSALAQSVDADVPHLTEPAPIAPEALKELLGAHGVRLVDLRPSMSYRKEHVDGAVWSIRPRLAAAVARPQQRAGLPLVLIADEPGIAALAAHDLAAAGVQDVRLLAGGHPAARAAGLAMAATPDAPADADCVDFLFFTHGRHDGDAAAARQYLAWEMALVGQLDADERAAFRI